MSYDSQFSSAWTGPCLFTACEQNRVRGNCGSGVEMCVRGSQTMFSAIDGTNDGPCGYDVYNGMTRSLCNWKYLAADVTVSSDQSVTISNSAAAVVLTPTTVTLPGGQRQRILYVDSRSTDVFQPFFTSIPAYDSNDQSSSTSSSMRSTPTAVPPAVQTDNRISSNGSDGQASSPFLAMLILALITSSTLIAYL